MDMDELYKKAKLLLAQNRLINVISFASSKVWLIEMMESTGVVAVYLHKEDPTKDECECRGYKKKGLCEHIIAADKYLTKKGFNRQKQMQAVSKQLIQTPMQVFNQVLQQSMVKQKAQEELSDYQVSLEVGLFITEEYYLADRQELYISLRIGKVNEKTYLVRDITTLVKAYFEQQIYHINKNISCHFKFEQVDHNSHQVMCLLKELLKYPTVFHYEHKERLKVPFHLVREFLALVNAKENVTLRSVFSTNDEVITLSDRPLLKMILRSIGEQYILSVTSENWHVFEFLEYVLVENQLYDLHPRAVLLYQQLWQLFEKGKRKEIVIAPVEQVDFFDVVLPQLERFTDIFVQKDMPISVEKSDVQIDVIRYDEELRIVLSDRLPFEKQYQFEKQLYHWGFEQRDEYTFIKAIDESWVSFLTQDVLALQAYGQVHLDEYLESNIILETPEIDMAMNADNSLFTMTFQMEGITQQDVDSILRTIQEKKHYYEFSDGRLLSLETKAFDKVNRVLHQLRQSAIKNGKLNLSRLEGLQLTQTVEGLRVSESIQELIDDLRNPERLNISVPKQVSATLKPYQEFGFKWLSMLSKHGLGGVLADDMGLGKTLQSITYLMSEYVLNHNQNKPSVIITPASLIYNWAHECQQFAPDLPIVIVNGTKKEREEIYQENRQKNVVFITSYPAFRSDAQWYHEDTFHAVILDESQIVKNHLTKQHHSLRGLTYHCLFALSGTPVENRKEDLWSIYALVLPGLLPNISEYRRLDEQAIARLIKPFLLRRLKTDVLLELPDKLESVIYNDLTKEQKKLYIGYLQRMQETVLSYDAKTFKKNRIEILTGLTRLRQLCCDPSLFIDNYKGASGKLEQCKEMVLTALAGQHRVLIFSQFASMLDIIEEELHALEVETFKLTGQTPVSQRQDMVNAFNEGDKQVFLMSLKAGGVGLNLTSADTIILYDLWWNPAVEEQATSRAHRIGQKSTVQVYRLISQGTIEEKIMQLQQKKRDLLDDMMTNETAGIQTRQSLSDEDIKEILGIEE